MDRPDPTDRSLQQLAREHAKDERLAQDLAQQTHTLIPQDIAAKLPPLYSQEEQGENAFEYWVYRPSSKPYRHCDWLLANVGQQASGGRRWVII